MNVEEMAALLFVPGDRPDRFAKAAASGADGMILDLEDAVGEARKQTVRDAVGEWLSVGGAGFGRINAPGPPWFEADLNLRTRHGRPVMLPRRPTRRCSPVSVFR